MQHDRVIASTKILDMLYLMFISAHMVLKEKFGISNMIWIAIFHSHSHSQLPFPILIIIPIPILVTK